MILIFILKYRQESVSVAKILFLKCDTSYSNEIIYFSSKITLILSTTFVDPLWAIPTKAGAHAQYKIRSNHIENIHHQKSQQKKNKTKKKPVTRNKRSSSVML